MTTARPRVAWMGTAPAGREGSVQEGAPLFRRQQRCARHPKRRALRGVQERNLTVRVFFRGKIRSSFGQVFDRGGVGSLKTGSVTPSGLGGAPAECPMVSACLRRCSRLRRLAAKLHHGENAGWSGNGLEMVWFSRRALERGSMTHRSTTILQAENQNRSKTSPVSAVL